MRSGKNEEQENQICWRLNAREAGNRKEYLRENAHNKQQPSNNEPEDRVLQLHLRITHLARNEDKREQRNKDKTNS